MAAFQQAKNRHFDPKSQLFNPKWHLISIGHKIPKSCCFTPQIHYKKSTFWPKIAAFHPKIRPPKWLLFDAPKIDIFRPKIAAFQPKMAPEPHRTQDSKIPFFYPKNLLPKIDILTQNRPFSPQKSPPKMAAFQRAKNRHFDPKSQLFNPKFTSQNGCLSMRQKSTFSDPKSQHFAPKWHQNPIGHRTPNPVVLPQKPATKNRYFDPKSPFFTPKTTFQNGCFSMRQKSTFSDPKSQLFHPKMAPEPHRTQDT